MRTAKLAFTLTEVLLAVVIVGIITVLVLPAVISNLQEKGFDQAFERETKTIESAVTGLAINENKVSFFDTMMYTDTEPENYENNVKVFLKKYIRISKICGDNNGDCFASKYYEYKNNDKIVYEPNFKGSCASLKNGMSICITPQVGAIPVHGIIDLNGPKGPNILNKDLRTFAFASMTRNNISTKVGTVLDNDFPPIPIKEDEKIIDPCEGMTCGCGTLPPCDPCAGKTCGCGTLPECPPSCYPNSNFWDGTCCKYYSSEITSPTHHCCTYYSIQNSVYNCKYHCEATVTGNINGSSGYAKFTITGNGVQYCGGFSYYKGKSFFFTRDKEIFFNPKVLENLCLNVYSVAYSKVPAQTGYGPCKYSTDNKQSLYKLMGNGNFSFTLKRDFL